jgi:ribosomal protein S3
MGQKIHPFGFRVGITKKHQSVWFARFQKHQYAQSVLEDRFLRKNLSKVLSEMFEKKFKNSENMPKISHIQIVRGLIPYEIGIQIHAENCHMIQSAFENFEVQPKVLHNFLKNHVLLEKTIGSEKVQKSQKTENKEVSQNSSLSPELEQSRTRKKSKNSVFGLRKKVFARFRERFLGKFLVLKNRKTISKKFDPNAQVSFKKNLRSFLGSSRSPRGAAENSGAFFRFGKQGIGESSGRNSLDRQFGFSLRGGDGRSVFGMNQKKKNQFAFSKSNDSSFRQKNSRNQETLSFKQKAFFEFLQNQQNQSKSSRSCSKFVNFYMSQTNISFFSSLKSEMYSWNTFLEKSKKSQLQKFGEVRSFPFGSIQKWSLRRFERFEKLSVPMLAKLFKALQQRAFQKMERLRKEYILFGKFSKARTFAYFQRIRFLQNFKKYIAFRKTNQSSSSFASFRPEAFQKNEGNATERQKIASKVTVLNEKSIQKKYQNFATQKNTMKFLEYFQDFVQQHRSKNLFLYLSTISDARQHLRKIQQFTKQQSEFLFGISMKNVETLSPEQQQNVLRNQVSKTFVNISQKNQNKNFHDVFVEQLQKQRTLCEQNIQLVPKISIQFYSVKPQNFKTRASAVADSIVDDLEKRKAFRRVIKKAKEDLMKTSKVKGVKIQVSGRLNGAEIARSEWVRAGRVPLQTLRANIDYCYKTAQTMYGIIGVKVWIYKGFTKMQKPSAKTSTVFSDLL